MISIEEARQHPEFKRIPAHILGSIYAYVEHRQTPGSFLRCVLTNDLFGAIGRADKESAATLKDIVVFINSHVRSDCYGRPEKVKEWLFPLKKAS